MIFGNFSLWTPKSAALFGVGPFILASFSAMVAAPCPFSGTVQVGAEKGIGNLENVESCPDVASSEWWLDSHTPRGEGSDRRAGVWGEEDGQLPPPSRTDSVVVALWGDGTAVVGGGRTRGTDWASETGTGARPEMGGPENDPFETSVPVVEWPSGGAVGGSFAPETNGPAVAWATAVGMEVVEERL